MSDLHGRIMNIAAPPGASIEYKTGHRDARHAAAEMAVSVADKRECAWIDDKDGSWLTGCGEQFQFAEDESVENGFRFCPYCGGALVVAEIEGEA